SGGSASALRSSSVSVGVRPRSSASKRMSRARFRALVRAEGTGSAADPAQVVPGTGVDLDLLAGGDEQRNLHLQSGLQRRRLGTAGAAIALQTWLGVGDLQLDRGRQVDVERVVLVQRNRDHLLLEQIVLRVADDVRVKAQLVVGLGVHEDPVAAVEVQVL